MVSSNSAHISHNFRAIHFISQAKNLICVGIQDGTPGDYGEKHIERKKRLQELQSNGYHNARDFVHDVAGRYTAIYSGESGRLILCKKGDGKGKSLFVELIPSDEGDFYDVKTGMVTRDTFFRNKKPLWEQTQSG